MPQRTLDYSSQRKPEKIAAKIIAFAFLGLGIFQGAFGVHELFGPPVSQNSKDLEIDRHNARVRILVGSVLMVPGGCVLLVLFKER